jgi:hypothetical protein
MVWEALFKADRDIYDVSWVGGMDLREDGFANSLFHFQADAVAAKQVSEKL